ncbi:putative ABC transport system ATP-binding protein [Lentzea xinjiangensis]|uniref:Putative ABC transport system ATP-binding protein n=1 Tax=Lentzea xinjiangensis TaxID=402600 RepID=A0A1H9NMJ8_9PSEU|nr:ABC transporter ATP-binding protein [Lentzea xinjiangensis]SER36603.1 putative ABC transport system ATP-binding protein [Lentzea xinjiangensis]
MVFAVEARALVKVYGKGDAGVRALDGVSVGFERGGFTAIMGPSGSGKSSLLHCLAGLDAVTSGQVLVGGVDITALSDRELTGVRRDRIGFVFQAFNLLPQLTAARNITLPLDLAGRRADRELMAGVVEVLGLADRLDHRPAELSGGQQQRVALARALVARPEVVFADEPTGNLDSRSGLEVLRFLRTSVRSFGQTVVMVTHDPEAAACADRAVLVADGRIVADLPNPSADQLRSLRPPAGAR